MSLALGSSHDVLLSLGRRGSRMLSGSCLQEVTAEFKLLTVYKGQCSYLRGDCPSRLRMQSLRKMLSLCPGLRPLLG